MQHADKQNVVGEDKDTAEAKYVTDYFENERDLFMRVKASKFYKNLCECTKLGRPVSFQDWLRLLLQVDYSLSINEIFRICDEEDGILSMSSVRSSPLHL